jgi:two-component system, cell cycle response regulator DivK
LPTILVVEDNEPTRDALSRRLERRGYHVLPAGDGRQAVSLARQALPNLILMDLGLPIVDGWNATRRLKNDARTRHIPIIVLSAYPMTSHRDMELASGGDDFDTKPINFENLLAKIETLLDARVVSHEPQPTALSHLKRGVSSNDRRPLSNVPALDDTIQHIRIALRELLRGGP